MIKTYIKNIISIFFLISFLNCNYSIPEKDKYPDMESFPKLSGVKSKIDSINDSIVVLKYDSEYYYAIGSSSLFVYYGDFKRIWKTRSDFYSMEIDHKKNIYMYSNEEVYKYSFPWAKKEKIEVINGYLIRDSIRKNLESLPEYAKIQDSIKNKKADSIKFKILEKKIKSDYISCYGFENSGYILFKYNDKEYCLYDYDLVKYYAGKKKFDSRWAKRMSEIQTNLKLYDQAVLGNGSSGNHFFFSFYPYGYAYYCLKIGDQTMNFKYYNDNLEQAKLKQWKNPFNNKIIISRYYNNSLYTLYLVSNK